MLPTKPPEADERSRVLIVEHDEDTGAMLTSMLEDRGYAVKWAQHGEEGLRLYIAGARSGHAPHVVLLDPSLPDMDGADLARSLSRSLRGGPPIIVLSALPVHTLLATARAIGARAALRKPFDVQRLLASVAAAIRPAETIVTFTPISGVTPDLLTAVHVLESALPELGTCRGGIAESPAWAAAHRVVSRTIAELGTEGIRDLGFDAALAQCAYLAACDAQSAFNHARVMHGAASLDFALVDSYCYSLLHLAIAIGRALAARTTAPVGTA
jgi:CheY-like chemotaxis protein